MSRKHTVLTDGDVVGEAPQPEAGFQHININSVLFTAPAPFSEGHVLSDVEANVLNRTFAENLRNNFAARMKKAAESGEAPLTQEDFNLYAAEYSFGVRPGRTMALNAVDVEERRLAEIAVKAAIKRKGIKLKGVDKDAWNGYVARAIESGKFREQAEEIVRQQASLADVDIDEAA